MDMIKIKMGELVTNEGQVYKLNNSHTAIISKEMFDAVQEDHLNRSNVEQTEDGPKRKKTKYSSKKRN